MIPRPTTPVRLPTVRHFVPCERVVEGTAEDDEIVTLLNVYHRITLNRDSISFPHEFRGLTFFLMIEGTSDYHDFQVGVWWLPDLSQEIYVGGIDRVRMLVGKGATKVAGSPLRLPRIEVPGEGRYEVRLTFDASSESQAKATFDVRLSDA